MPDDPQSSPPPEVSDTATPSSTNGQSEGVDMQLVGLCVALWIAALAIFGFRWETMRIDYHLGTLKAGLHEGRGIDPEARAALVEIATGNPGAIEHLRAELTDGLRTEIYRVGVLRVLADVPDKEATDALWACTEPQRGVNVRANAYDVLGKRLGELPPDDPAVVRLGNAALNDPHGFARTQAALALARVQPGAAAWPLLRLLRDLDGPDAQPLRERVAEALRTASGQAADALPYDPAAEQDVRDEQLRGWEQWYREAGGTIPPGETVDEVRAAQKQAQGQAEAAPEAGSQ